MTPYNFASSEHHGQHYLQTRSFMNHRHLQPPAPRGTVENRLSNLDSPPLGRFRMLLPWWNEIVRSLYGTPPNLPPMLSHPRINNDLHPRRPYTLHRKLRVKPISSD